MPLHYLQQIFILIKRLLICYLAYLFCRLVFYFSNIHFFPSAGFFDVLIDCFYGLRTDSFSIVVSNSLFILGSLLPFSFFWTKGYQNFLKWLYFIGNSVFIAFNCVDVAYFAFIRKRSGVDLIKQMGGQTDLWYLLPQFIKDFWWVLLFYLFIMALMVYLYRRILVRQPDEKNSSTLKTKALVLTLFLLSCGFSVLAVRGGFQRVPISIVDAGAATSPEETPIVLNTPFTIIKSLEETSLQEFNFYPPEKIVSLYNPVRHYPDSVFKKQNVVVIILESFGREYTKLSKYQSLTPFLDSLMDQSLVFTNAFSNGTKSIEGIPAILSGLPSLMENPFINSSYSLNNQTSFASLLKQEGYQTAFFHGGINGTMNFDSWALLAGYEAYYGKKEYNNNKDFDNFWGIWDEPFLQYSVEKMKAFKQPFHSAIFTLSSHHPYNIPEKHKNKFKKGPLENSESVRYADYSLRQFFKSAQKTDWYSNTLFVITADHGSLSTHDFFKNIVGNQGIPVLFFKPDNSLKEKKEQVFSQIDILPSTLNLLGYNKPFFSFGESFTEKKRGHDYIYASSAHFLYSDSMLHSFHVPELTQVFCYRSDSALSQPILNKYPQLDSTVLADFKAFIQTYNSTLIHNTGKLK